MRPVIVLGGSGLVGSRVCELWSSAFEVIAPRHSELDVLDSAALEAFLKSTSAASVVNLVAAADVDGSELEAGDTNGRVYQVNVDFPRRLAQLCQQQSVHLVHVSTDYVFDGTKANAAYTEDDKPRALCWYAETKLLGETGVLQTNPGACVARIEMPFTATQHTKRDLVRLVVTRLRDGQSMSGVTDQRITPVLLDDAASALGHLVDARFAGLVHVAASTWTTPYELALGIARRLDLPTSLVEPVAFAEFAPTRPARRPQHSWLSVTRFANGFGEDILRPVEAEIDVWARQWQSR